MKKYYHTIIILMIASTVVSGCGRNNAAKNEPADNSIKTGSTSEGILVDIDKIATSSADISSTTTQIQPKEEIKYLPNGDVDISDWKTYKNELIGFEMKYPGFWTILEENEYPRVHFYYDGIERDQLYPFDYGEAIWIQKIKKEDWIENKIEKFEKIKINGVYGKIYKNIPGGQEPGSAALFMDEIIIQKNNYFYFIQLYVKRPSAKEADKNIEEWLMPVNQKVFDKILTTFIFNTEVNTNILDWKTYKNSSFGFELKFPSEYEKNNLYSIWHSEEKNLNSIKQFGSWGVNRMQETIFSIDAYPIEQKEEVLKNRKELRGGKTKITINNDIIADKINYGSELFFIERKKYVYVITSSCNPSYNELYDEYKNILSTLKLE